MTQNWEHITVMVVALFFFLGITIDTIIEANVTKQAMEKGYVECHVDGTKFVTIWKKECK